MHPWVSGPGRPPAAAHCRAGSSSSAASSATLGRRGGVSGLCRAGPEPRGASWEVHAQMMSSPPAGEAGTSHQSEQDSLRVTVEWSQYVQTHRWFFFYCSQPAGGGGLLLIQASCFWSTCPSICSAFLLMWPTEFGTRKLLQPGGGLWARRKEPNDHTKHLNQICKCYILYNCPSLCYTFGLCKMIWLL